MGAATARILVDLGAEVHAIDLNKPDADRASRATPSATCAIPSRSTRRSSKIGSVVNMLFNCAGLPNTFPDLDVMLVNFCGLRHLTERVIPKMLEHADSAIASHRVDGRHRLAVEHGAARRPCSRPPTSRPRGVVRGASGRARERVRPLEGSDQRVHRDPFVRRSRRRGIRINCLNPGPTDTPMMPEFEQAVGKDYMDNFPVPLGRHAVADEQAWPLVFLNSPRASFVTGAQLDADGGFKGGLFTGQIDPSVLMPPDVSPGRSRPESTAADRPAKMEHVLLHPEEPSMYVGLSEGTRGAARRAARLLRQRC